MVRFLCVLLFVKKSNMALNVFQPDMRILVYADRSPLYQYVWVIPCQINECFAMTSSDLF